MSNVYLHPIHFTPSEGAYLGYDDERIPVRLRYRRGIGGHRSVLRRKASISVESLRKSGYIEGETLIVDDGEEIIHTAWMSRLYYDGAIKGAWYLSRKHRPDSIEPLSIADSQSRYRPEALISVNYGGPWAHTYLREVRVWSELGWRDGDPGLFTSNNLPQSERRYRMWDI